MVAYPLVIADTLYTYNTNGNNKMHTNPTHPCAPVGYTAYREPRRQDSTKLAREPADGGNQARHEARELLLAETIVSLLITNPTHGYSPKVYAGLALVQDILHPIHGDVDANAAGTTAQRE